MMDLSGNKTNGRPLNEKFSCQLPPGYSLPIPYCLLPIAQFAPSQICKFAHLHICN